MVDLQSFSQPKEVSHLSSHLREACFLSIVVQIVQKTKTLFASFIFENENLLILLATW